MSTAARPRACSRAAAPHTGLGVQLQHRGGRCHGLRPYGDRREVGVFRRPLRAKLRALLERNEADATKESGGAALASSSRRPLLPPGGAGRACARTGRKAKTSISAAAARTADLIRAAPSSSAPSSASVPCRARAVEAGGPAATPSGCGRRRHVEELARARASRRRLGAVPRTPLALAVTAPSA